MTTAGAIFSGEDIAAFFECIQPGRRAIGIDAGTKTLGLALSDAELSIATPLETIERKKFSIDAVTLFERATALEVSGFVLGLPINLDGSEGPRAQSTRQLAKNLVRLDPRPILLWDERMTTMAAERALLEADTSRRRRAELIDKVAAALILQSALDRIQHIWAAEHQAEQRTDQR